jgi:hypothetical protein
VAVAVVAVGEEEVSAIPGLEEKASTKGIAVVETTVAKAAQTTVAKPTAVKTAAKLTAAKPTVAKPTATKPTVVKREATVTLVNPEGTTARTFIHC